MQNLNLNSLRMFLSAAQNGSFLKAAGALNISQGAVSQRIKQLELELGVVLFEREARGVSLTKAGHEFAQTVETSLAMIDRAARHIQETGTQITVHASPSIARKWLTPRLPEFSRANPHVQLSIEARADVLPRPLHQNEIAMRHGKRFPDIQSQHMRPLQDVDLVAVCSPDLPDVGPDPSLKHMLTLPLIEDTHRRWDKLVEQHGLSKPRKSLNFNSASLAIDAAINGQGVAIAPSQFVDRDIAHGRLNVIWQDPEPSGEFIFLVWPKQRVPFKPLMDVVQWIHADCHYVFDRSLTDKNPV